jgi:FkbM family methyltransferase
MRRTTLLTISRLQNLAFSGCNGEPSGRFRQAIELPLGNKMPKHFSQLGQDIMAEQYLLRRHKRKVKDGFYVDIGSFHPVKWSNTYKFYVDGWRGICVDPNASMKEKYDEARPEDTFVVCGVGHEPGVINYYTFSSAQHNTCDPTMGERRRTQLYPDRFLGFQEAPIRTLTEILDEHAPAGVDIDILSIDVDGGELSVLKSLDFARYRPRIIIMESTKSIPGMLKAPEHLHVMEQGYHLCGHTGHDTFYSSI